MRNRPTTPEDEQALRELGDRLESLGLLVGSKPYFGIPGIAAWRPQPPLAPGEIRPVDRFVFLYASADGWAARVTPHGGPHWVRSAQSAAALEEFAVEALGTTAMPPSEAWQIAD